MYRRENFEKYEIKSLWSPSIQNLIIVAGHTIFIGNNFEETDEKQNWYLESYQKDELQAFLQHIKHGVKIAAKDNSSLLLFSGGHTRQAAGPRTEALSYWSVAEALDWFGFPYVRWRALTEEFSRDSFENLLFSICRFREIVGRYPKNITIVSFDFKRTRFVELHRAALRFPSERFFYKGIDPVDTKARFNALKGEQENALLHFEKDPYGCRSPLREKREERNPFMMSHPYPKGCPELERVFSYCGTSIFQSQLPW